MPMFFLEVVVIFFIFTSGSSSAVKRRDACRAPRSAESYLRLGNGARPTITGGQTRERWSDAMASARRRASLERVVCSLFFILI